MRFRKAFIIPILIMVALNGCVMPARLPQDLPPLSTLSAQIRQTLTPGVIMPTVSENEISDFEPTQTTPEITPEVDDPIYLHEGIPESIIKTLSLEEYVVQSEPGQTQMTINLGPAAAGEVGQGESIWTYVLVAPFFTLIDQVSFDSLQALWQGTTYQENPFTQILVTPSTQAAMTEVLGRPDPAVVNTVTKASLLELALTRRGSLAIMPFEELNPQFKVLRIDGASPIDPAFDSLKYPLSVKIWLSGTWPGELPGLPAGNYDPDRRTILIMTGVSALTRATAYQMAIRGETFPGRDIRSWLLEADLTHISHEVPFAENCPYPNPVQEDLIFCAAPERIALFEDLGVDIIELTGNHLLDFGEAAAYLTLQLYQDRSWVTYAGGLTLSEAQSPAKITHNSNRLAFLGCNLPGPPNVWAGESKPGAAPCGDYSWMEAAIQDLVAEGYLPIVTLQYNEDYSAIPGSQMERDFIWLAEAGAVVINGSQAHTPKIMGFHQNAFLHFGLGNLFFDQMAVYYQNILMEGTRDEFIDRLVFYDNRLVSVELLTAKLEDYARPRPMTAEEREVLLARIFDLAYDDQVERVP